MVFYSRSISLQSNQQDSVEDNTDGVSVDALFDNLIPSVRLGLLDLQRDKIKEE